MKRVSSRDKPTKHSPPSVAVVSFPWESGAPYLFLSDLLLILEPISDKVVIIGGNTARIRTASEKITATDIGIGMHYLREIGPLPYSALLWLVKSILVQIRESVALVRLRGEVDVVLFYIAYPYYLMPLVTSRLLGIPSIEIVTRSRPGTLVTRIHSLQDPIVYRLLSGISPESEGLIAELSLEKYGNKILAGGARFIDTERFRVTRPFRERGNVVGFIGRLKREKGIGNFLDAAVLIAQDEPDVGFLICGAGDLAGEVAGRSQELRERFGAEIRFPGWVGEEMPDMLNELKLLVLPTYADAFPTIVLEAMACGTPVLAPAIGAIPDVVRDEDTGFILETNTPETIAAEVIAALSHPRLEEISGSAAAIIRDRYSLENAVARYHRILNGE
jgi:glycosyltransferase involved in cell wall biosynthesis